MLNHHTLYSFRRCPFAMRARIALYTAKIPIQIHEVSLKAKPDEMLSASPKGTVPVLVLNDGTVIDESFEIMMWALKQNDPNHLLIEDENLNQQSLNLVSQSGELNRLIREVKFNIRHDDLPLEQAWQNIFPNLDVLEAMLKRNAYLLGNKIKYIDYAIFPFIRQLIHIDKAHFQTLAYPNIFAWYSKIIIDEVFKKVMDKSLTTYPD